MSDSAIAQAAHVQSSVDEADVGTLQTGLEARWRDGRRQLDIYIADLFMLLVLRPVGRVDGRSDGRAVGRSDGRTGALQSVKR